MSAKFLIDGATAGAFNPEVFVKTAAGEEEGFDFKKLLENPMVGYGLAGAGVGGVASLLRSLLGNPDPDVEGGMISRLIKALTMGGLAGAGIAGGAKLLGKDLPSPTKLIPSITGGDEGGDEDAADGKDPSWQTSAGVGLTGATGAGLLGLLARRRINNRALSRAFAGISRSLPGGAATRQQVANMGPKSYLGRLAARFRGYSQPEALGLRRFMSAADDPTTATGQQFGGQLDQFGDVVEKATKNERRRLREGGSVEGMLSKITPKGALGTGAGLGILHQLIGRE